MIPDFNAVHQQIARLAKLANRDGSQKDSYDSVIYEVGTTLAALGGVKALHAAFDYIEINVGEREAVWLSRRWAGLPDPDGNCLG